MKNLLVGFGIAIILALVFFFFYIVPEQKSVEKKIEDVAKTDTVYIEGKTQYIYDTTYITSRTPVITEIIDTAKLKLTTTFDTVITSNSDTIGLKASIEMQIESGIVDYARWFLDLDHKKYQPLPDTVIIKTPYEVKVLEYKKDWLAIFISFLGGILASIILFLI